VPSECEEEDATLTLTAEQRETLISDLEVKMRQAAKAFEFEKAAQFRDRIKALKACAIYEDGTSPTRPYRGG
jgi:excinuclease ABC subunit B